MITITDASEADIETLRDLAERIWWPSYAPILQKEQIAYMLQTIYSADTMREVIRDGSQQFIILFENNAPKGFASYGNWSNQPATWKVFKLYVLPDCHGKGFGKRLIDEINSRAWASGITTMVLNVNRKNPAFHFYLKNGFKVYKEEDIPIGPYWMNDFVMIRPVGQSNVTKNV